MFPKVSFTIEGGTFEMIGFMRVLLFIINIISYVVTALFAILTGGSCGERE